MARPAWLVTLTRGWYCNDHATMVWLQQAEVAELNRRAQHAEQESSAARAEAAAVRQAAAQQQAERAIAQYTQVNQLAGLPFQEAQTTREYDPLPGLGMSRYSSLLLRTVQDMTLYKMDVMLTDFEEGRETLFLPE